MEVWDKVQRTHPHIPLIHKSCFHTPIVDRWAEGLEMLIQKAAKRSPWGWSCWSKFEFVSVDNVRSHDPLCKHSTTSMESCAREFEVLACRLSYTQNTQLYNDLWRGQIKRSLSDKVGNKNLRASNWSFGYCQRDVKGCLNPGYGEEWGEVESNKIHSLSIFLSSIGGELLHRSTTSNIFALMMG